MTLFAQRKPSDRKVTVTVSRDVAAMMPDALRHVASEVFDGEDRRSVTIQGMLRDASSAVRDALGTAGAKVIVELTERELEHAPDALRHVASHVFESDEEGRYLLRDAAQALSDALVRTSSPKP